MFASFVEDRLATLKNVIKEPELDGWNLYLGNRYYPASHCYIPSFFVVVVLVTELAVKAGDWGYNTKKEREEAASIPRIQLLQLPDFSKKLK